jgi:aspartyl-tRNA synthetase
LSFAQRTVPCGEVSEVDVDKEVVINGWVNRVRDHGGFIFTDVRDRTGIVQVVADGSASEQALDQASAFKSEACVSIRGLVRIRPEGTENDKLRSGKVEILARHIEVLNPCKVLPFPVAEETNVDEMLRLKYRYLDLRRPVMYEKLRVRHEVIRLMRQYMYNQGFLEIETPIITRATPEGARDYLVPYRLAPGLFYALPQAPQQFKQLLMVSGVERYFPIANRSSPSWTSKCHL